MNFYVPLHSDLLLQLLQQYKSELQDEDKIRRLSEANWEKLIYLEHNGFLRCQTHEVSTGRHHTASPNVQGLPKALRGCIRESGKYILWSDWVASHPNLLAGLSGDEQLQQDVQGDCYSVFDGFDRSVVKLFMLLFLNGSGNSRLSEVCGLSDFEVARLKKIMRRRWSRAFECLDEWKNQAKYNGYVQVSGHKIKVPDSYKAPSFVLQYIEAQNMLSVAEEQIDGARLIMTVHDELVWSVDPDKIESVSETVMQLMSRFGRAEVEYGSGWTVADAAVCAEYVNSSEKLFNEFYDLKDEEYDVYGADDLIDGKYISEIAIPAEHRHHIFIKSPKGTGKTQAFKRAVRAYQEQGARVLSITPIRSLAKEQSIKIDLPHYKKDYDAEIDGSAVLVINSVLRVCGDVDILFLDEVTAILSCIKHKGHGRNAGTISDAEVEQVLMKLQQLIQDARVVICADADLNGYAVNFVRAARQFDPSNESFCVIKTERQDTRVLYDNDKVLKEKILQDLEKGKKIWVASTSKGEVKKMHELISAMYPDKTGIVLHSDSDDKEDIIAELDETILQLRPDYVLVSPTVQAGVSVDLDRYFDYVAGFYRSGIMISSTFDQMLGRVRRPVSQTAHVWVDKRDYSGCTDAEIILKNLYNRDKICALSIGYVARCGSPEKVIYTDRGYTLRQSRESVIYNEFYCAQVAQENARGSSCARQGYISYVRANGVKYMWFGDNNPSPEILDAYREASEAVKMQDLRNVRDAEPISIVRAQSLVEEETTAEERRSIARAYVLDTYGEVNDDTITLYDGGKGRKQIKNLALCIDLIRGGDWVTYSDISQRKKGLSCATFDNKTPLILLISDILQEFGVLSCDGVPIFTPICDDVPAARITQFVDMLNELGLSIDQKTAKKHPARMVSSVCKKVGLRLSNKRVMRDGKRSRIYYLDKTHTEFILSTPYWNDLQQKKMEYEQERSRVIPLSETPPEQRYSAIKFEGGVILSVVMMGSDIEVPFDLLSESEKEFLRGKYKKMSELESQAPLQLQCGHFFS